MSMSRWKNSNSNNIDGDGGVAESKKWNGMTQSDDVEQYVRQAQMKNKCVSERYFAMLRIEIVVLRERSEHEWNLMWSRKKKKKASNRCQKEKKTLLVLLLLFVA